METTNYLIALLKRQKILPLFYHNDATVCVEVTRALYRAGVRAIEYTNRGNEALVNFKAIALARHTYMNDLKLATGTIRTAAEAQAFIDAGADFIISPFFDTAIGEAARRNNILWIPGCMTPTEIHHAGKSGFHFVKIFPGQILQPYFIESIKELFPQADFMVTGGVESQNENIRRWLDAGACGVGIGGKLISKSLMEKKDYVAMEQLTKQLLDMLHS